MYNNTTQNILITDLIATRTDAERIDYLFTGEGDVIDLCLPPHMSRDDRMRGQEFFSGVLTTNRDSVGKVGLTFPYLGISLYFDDESTPSLPYEINGLQGNIIKPVNGKYSVRIIGGSTASGRMKSPVQQWNSRDVDHVAEWNKGSLIGMTASQPSSHPNLTQGV